MRNDPTKIKQVNHVIHEIKSLTTECAPNFISLRMEVTRNHRKFKQSSSEDQLL